MQKAHTTILKHIWVLEVLVLMTTQLNELERVEFPENRFGFGQQFMLKCNLCLVDS